MNSVAKLHSERTLAKHVSAMNTPLLLYSKTGLCRDIPIFGPKHILWVLVRTVSIHNLCFEQKFKKKKKKSENFHIFILKKISVHLENSPMQYTEIFSAVKIENFVGNNLMFYLFMLKKH